MYTYTLVLIFQTVTSRKLYFRYLVCRYNNIFNYTHIKTNTKNNTNIVTLIE